jgi:hypothetical protein
MGDMNRLSLFGGRVVIEYGEGVTVSLGERKCAKVRYGHRETAEKACEAMKRKRGEILESYECRDGCGGWHIGHSRW